MKIVLADANLMPHTHILKDSLEPDDEIQIFDVFVTDVVEPHIAQALEDCDVFIGSKLPPTHARHLKNAELIHAAGAGVDGITTQDLPSGTVIANTGHHGPSMAEYIAASLVMLQRQTRRQDALLRQGEWSSSVYDSAQVQPQTLRGKTAVFLGFGHIGQNAWQLLRHFGVEGIAVTTRGVDAQKWGLKAETSPENLNEVLSQASILIASVPLSDVTRGMISTPQLEALGSEGIVVNVARGPVVDERALFDALASKTIAGAILDVWYSYPDTSGFAYPSQLPFGALENVLMTPHSSGITEETFRLRMLEISENISLLRQGQQLKNVVFRA